MTTDKRSQLLAHYQKLPAEQQELLKLLSVYYDFAQITLIAKALPLLKLSKTLKTDALKPILQALLRSQLLEQPRNQPSFRSQRMLAESITRQLVSDNEFELYARVIEKISAFNSNDFHRTSAEDYLRHARIQFYRGDYAKVNQILDVGRRYKQLPNILDIYLSWLSNPLDADWLSRQHPLFVQQYACYLGLHQLLYLYDSPEIISFLQQQCQLNLENQPPLLKRVLAELLLLRGDSKALQVLLDNSSDAELQAITAARLFLQGDVQAAVAQYDTALRLLRKQSGKRTTYFYGLAGVFYPLALLKINNISQRSQLDTLLTQAIKCENIWQGIYRYIVAFQQFSQGDLNQREVLLRTEIPYKTNQGFSETGMPETVVARPLLLQVFLLLIKFWTKAEHFDYVTPLSQQLYQQLHNNGYRWPAAELAKIFITIEPNKAKQWDVSFFEQQPQALAELFTSRPDWELALDALLHLNNSDHKTADGATEGKAARLCWFVSYSETEHSILIEAREQKLQAKGGWSKGRTVSLKRLHTERDSFDYLSEADLKLCAHIKEYRENGWYGNNHFYDFDSSMPLALIGHPLLFWADSPTVKIDAVKGEAELRVSKASGKKIKITLEPLPKFEQKVHVSKETPTRLRVVEFTADHHKIFSVLGAKGLEVPASAQDKVLQTLTNIAGLLTVHSDIGGSSSIAEQTVADATPRIHLLPHGEGLRASLLIRPFSSEGAYYPPGHGGESVLAEIDGKPLQARRNLAKEKTLAKSVINACPVLQSNDRDDSGDWLLEDPETCLELLLQLQALPSDQAILEWPEGVKFKLLGQTHSNSFNLQIKRDNDWFALQGELRVNEDTVIEIQQLLGLLSGSPGRFLRLQDGQFIALTDAFRRRLDDLKAYADISGKKVRINPLAALTLEDWDDEIGGLKADKHWQAHIQQLKSAREFQPVLPSTFQAELRDYQIDGYNWLARLAQWRVGACLADDMGLGKTVQGLALLVDRAPQGPSLIIAPTSVCMNWENESRRFAPTLNPKLLGSGDRQQLLDNLAPYDLLICSYGLLQQEQAAEMLAKIPFQTVILDEAQAIKNAATRRSQGAMSLQAEFKIIMTGTPLENHLGELWNLFRFINPGLLGSLEQFNQRFAGPIERDRSHQARQQLKKLIQPFILRRTKTQVLQELPPRTEIPIFVELSNEEMAFYEALRRESLATLNSSDGAPGQKHLQILAAISKLRRSCCNTLLANADVSLPSSKLAAFGEIVDELLENKHKALVFSQFVDHLQLIKDYIEQRGIAYQYLDGSTPAKDRQQRVDAFQRGEGELFLISLKAGGVGLNLTAADYVIHMDPWWNPAVEDQASDRAHRMGQLRPVTIYRMIAKQTIEEKIVALHSHKRDLADSLLDGADISGKISTDDLLSLMRGDSA